MDLLLILLVGIIGILIFLLLKKERVFGIKEENKIENKTLKNEVVTDNKENIYKLFNYIPEAIIILNKSKEILFSNSSAQKRFEISKNNNINSYLRNPDLIKAIEDAFIGKNPKDLEIEVKNRAMQRMNITIYFDSNNLFFNEPNCLLFIRDLTEFYKFQELKSDFVANVSHELRTPLQSIKMGLETFENNESLKNNSEIKDFLPVMISQSERMENLIRDLLSLSKIELQEHIRPTHEIDLNNVIEYVIKTHEKILNKHQIQIQFKKVNDFKIIGDNDKLIEIFTNLIDNAIKYSEKNKKIAIYGIGGVGHMAIQFAKVEGCEVTGISRKMKHLDVAKSLGAQKVFQFTESQDDFLKQIKDDCGLFDAAVVFAPADLVTDTAIKSVKKGGTVVIATVGKIPNFLAFEEKTVRGTLIGSMKDMEKVIEIAGKNNFKVVTESFPLEEANEVLERLKNSDIEARAVLIP